MRPTTERKVRWGIARGADGAEVFVPWHPFSRSAWVIPTPEDCAALQRRTRFYLIGWCAVLLAVGVARHEFDLPYITVPLLVPLAAAHWALWTRRATRGLERTRYEKFAG